jgi:hypothetical protein
MRNLPNSCAPNMIDIAIFNGDIDILEVISKYVSLDTVSHSQFVKDYTKLAKCGDPRLESYRCTLEFLRLIYPRLPHDNPSQFHRLWSALAISLSRLGMHERGLMITKELIHEAERDPRIRAEIKRDKKVLAVRFEVFGSPEVDEFIRTL